jgi:hypothetical protein
MSKVELNVLFKKIQKDDKKEVLEFHVQGDELPHSDELVQMAGSIVVLNVPKSEAGEINVEFKSIQRDSKKTNLKFNIKGDSDDKMNKLYPYAGRTVSITLEASQMSIEEFNDHEGVEYQVDQDGTAAVVPDQMSLEDIENEAEPIDEMLDEILDADIKADEDALFDNDDLLD